MTLLLVAVAIIISCFGFVLLFGAPYLPTLRPQLKTGLELLDLKPGDTMLELGCGDGRVLLAAAEQGIRVVGYELNPLLGRHCAGCGHAGTGSWCAWCGAIFGGHHGLQRRGYTALYLQNI